MSLQRPIQNFFIGLRSFPRGIVWLFSNPKFMLLLALPMLFSCVVIVIGWQWLPQVDDWVIAKYLFQKPNSWYLVWLWWFVRGLYIVLVRVFVLLFAVLLTNILWVPIYEWVSCGVEKTITQKPIPEMSLWKSLLLMKEELKKLIFILSISLVSLFIFNAFAVFITAFLMGWDVMDYPLARRGWSFRQRFAYLWQHGFQAIGVGLWLVIPFVQFFIYPLSIAGGSLLTVEALSSENRLTD